MKFLLRAIAAITVLGIGVAVLSGLIGETSRGRTLTHTFGIPRPAVIAHRGASHLAPEETRPAFLMARELGADYLEFDIQRTKDGVLIAFHDDDLSRTTNVSDIFPGREKDTIDTFSFTELQRLDAGSWFNRQYPDRARESFKGLGILRLEEIIDIAESGSQHPGLYIETKAAHRYPGIERQIVAILAGRKWINGRRSQERARVIFQSFEADSLARLKELAPEIPRVLLIDELMISKDGWEGTLKQAAQVGTGLGTWGYQWAHSPSWSLNDAPERYITTWPWYTGEAHRAGLFVHVWTIDERWEMWTLQLSGADGIFTNRSDVALSVFGRANHDDLTSLWKNIGYQ